MDLVITCCAAGHGERRGHAGHTDVLGQVTGATNPDAAWGVVCDACVDMHRAWLRTAQVLADAGIASPGGRAQWLADHRDRLPALVREHLAARPLPPAVAAWLDGHADSLPLHVI